MPTAAKVAVVDATGKVLDTRWSTPPTANGRRTKPSRSSRSSSKARRGAHCHRQRHGEPRDRADDRRAHSQGRRRAQLHDRERGGRVGLLRKQARRGGISAVRRQPPLRCVHRQKIAGPAGGAGEDRPQGHRRGAVSARYAAKGAGREPERRGRGLRQCRRRGPQHRLPLAAHARGRSQQDHRQRTSSPSARRTACSPRAVSF